MFHTITEAAAGRHPSVQAAARWLEPNPNLPEHLHDIAAEFAGAGIRILDAIQTDDPQLIMALHKLVEAKDCAVRAAIVAVEQA